MKVSIITLHHVRNYGSLLQTFATQESVKRLGFQAEIIDYIPQGLTLKCGIRTIKNQGNPLKNFVRKTAATLVFSLQQRTMICFLKKNICLSKNAYYSYDDLLECPPVSDIYLAGSDQIWNTQNRNKDGDIKGYYLQFAPAGKKLVSYASSIGKDSFSAEESLDVKAYLEKFSAISVREDTAVDMLNHIGIQGAVHVLDPTMLISSDEWFAFMKKNLKNKSASKKKFVFVYNLNRNPHVKAFACKLAEAKNLEIINFADTLDFMRGATNRLHNTVYDFLYYLFNAEYVVTDSFHGTAFSINLGKKFISFSAPRFNSRLESILKLFGLENRLLQTFSGNIDIADVEIDYDSVFEKLEEQRQRSFDYLSKALTDKG